MSTEHRSCRNGHVLLFFIQNLQNESVSGFTACAKIRFFKRAGSLRSHGLPDDLLGTKQTTEQNIVVFTGIWGFQKALIEEKMLELESVRRRREQEEMHSRMERERPHISKMQEIMKEQLYDEALIEETMQNEWNLIKKSGVLDSLVPDEDEQESIRMFLIKYYNELSDMYKFFSAINSGGGTHTLEYIEFSKFLCETGIFQATDHSNVMLKIFLESHIENETKFGATATNIHTEIRQHEFFVSLIKISVYKYITLKRKEIATLKKKGHEASIAKAETPSQSQAIEMLYDDFLKPVIDKMPAGAAMKVALGSDEVLLCLHEHLSGLSSTFSKCAESEGGVSASELHISPPNGLITLRQFQTFATDAGFLGSTTSDEAKNDEVTVKDMRQVFSASQHDRTTNDDEMKLVQKGDRDSHQTQMDFAEFLEAVARLGVIKWKDFGYTHLERIRLAVEKTCQVQGNQEQKKQE